MDCIVFSQTQNIINLKEKRVSSASVLLNETTLWILGGSNTCNSHEFPMSTEFITLDTDNSVYGPALPMKIIGPCAVKFNDSHIYLIGGIIE